MTFVLWWTEQTHTQWVPLARTRTQCFGHNSHNFDSPVHTFGLFEGPLYSIIITSIFMPSPYFLSLTKSFFLCRQQCMSSQL